jgi:hypothetical protein
MKRRDLLVAGSCAAGLGVLGQSTQANAAPAAGTKEYLELRLYAMASAEKRDAYVKFLKDTAVPALNRIGIDRVGVWKMQKESDPNLYVLLPHKTIASFATARQRLLADKAYLDGAAPIYAAPKKDPAYKRIESSLLLSFDAAPKVEVPTTSATRIFQLRIYESHTEERGQRKIHMFNEGGEIALFRKKGLCPVFFGESLVGTKVPNLTYMVGFETPEAGKAAWKAFGPSPEWRKLARDPFYKDTVSNITNLFLLPTEASQI